MSEKKEYIERGALMGEIRKHFETIGANAERLVARFPAADVEPVVRGEWEEDGAITRCSVCGEHKEFPHWTHCPNCGAHMERSESGE